MQTDYLLNTIIAMVRANPNDTALGAKVRAIIAPIIQEQSPTSGPEQPRQLLKD